jgi:hypothetical protein
LLLLLLLLYTYKSGWESPETSFVKLSYDVMGTEERGITALLFKRLSVSMDMFECGEEVMCSE